MNQYMIDITDVGLTIRGREILHEINVQFECGKTYGLVGRNGSGKTMLMKCICGFVHPTHGTVRVNGKLIGKDIDFPENMGVIIENPSFISHMSGLRNLEILAGYKKCISTEHVKKIMELVNLDPESRLPVSKYSLGMKQRLGIAQAIMENPKLLVLDEPFNGLDEDGVKEVRNILLKMKQTGFLNVNPVCLAYFCEQICLRIRHNTFLQFCDPGHKAVHALKNLA